MGKEARAGAEGWSAIARHTSRSVSTSTAPGQAGRVTAARQPQKIGGLKVTAQHLHRQDDRKLNQTYTQILSVLQPDDQQKLRTAQRLWVQFRDTTCAAERDLYEGGTGANPALLACVEEEARLRTNDLRATYGWLVEKFAK